MLIKTDKSLENIVNIESMVNIQQLLSTTKTIFITFHQEQLQNKGPYFKVLNRSGSVAR